MTDQTFNPTLSAGVKRPGALASAFTRLCTLNNLLQAIGVGGGLWGTVLINDANIAGFFFWMVSNAALLGLQYRTRLWGLVGLHAVYVYMSVQGFGKWAARSPGTLPGWVPESLTQLAQLVT